MGTVARRLRRSVVPYGRYRLRVVSRGPVDGPHAILLPGMAANAHDLAPQMRLLRCLGYTVHVVELPGFGLPPALATADASVSQLSDMVAGVIDALGLKPALLLGHSLGGGIALHVALKRPELVERLVLLAPAAVGRSLVWIYRLYCLPLLGRALLRPYRQGKRRYLAHFLVGSKRRGDRHFVDSLVRRDGRAKHTALSMRAIVWANRPHLHRRPLDFLLPGREQSSFWLGSRLAELREIPMLVLWGNEDRVIPARHVHAIRAANPGAQVYVARGFGHLLPLEAAVWTNEHLERFASPGARSPLERAG